MASEQYGYLLLDTNPAMLPNESMHILVCKNGVLFLKFYDKMQDVSQFKLVIPLYIESVFKQSSSIIKSKLITNKALVGSDGKLKFPTNIVYVFPHFS